MQYIAATLHRDREYILPLAAVIQERTSGNPFFVIEMLKMCYRKNCLYYSWKDSRWEYNLDRVFDEFVEPTYGSTMNNNFVAKRLLELPAATRYLLMWASLIGNTFSFSLVKALLKGEPISTTLSDAKVPFVPEEDPVIGLQGALNAYLLVADEDEDRFRFSHDRYMQAAYTLSESYDHEEMHFLIAKQMIEQDFEDSTTTASKSLFVRSRHVCLAINLIRVSSSRYHVKLASLVGPLLSPFRQGLVHVRAFDFIALLSYVTDD